MKRLNESLEKINTNTNYMVYSAKPLKFAFFNFIAGVFHSLGSLFGTVILAGAIIYIFSQFKLNVVDSTSKFLEDSFSRINWQKVIPMPTEDSQK